MMCKKKFQSETHEEFSAGVLKKELDIKSGENAGQGIFSNKTPKTMEKGNRCEKLKEN